MDGWQLPDNVEDGVCYSQPRTLAQRCAAARDMLALTEGVASGAALVVDSMDNACELAYEARPERLYVIRDGVVAFRSGPGPFCYSPSQLREYLRHGTPAK